MLSYELNETSDIQHLPSLAVFIISWQRRSWCYSSGLSQTVLIAELELLLLLLLTVSMTFEEHYQTMISKLNLGIV